MALGQDRGDLGGHGAIIGVMHGDGGTSLSTVRLCGMDVIPRKALDMYGSPHLTISYLLRDEQRDFEDKSRAWIGDTWVWPMLGWRIVILANTRLKASRRFPSLRGMYQRGTCEGVRQ